MSGKHNEQDISDELKEELRIVEEIYAERLKNREKVLSGEELRKEALKKFDEIIKKGPF